MAPNKKYENMKHKNIICVKLNDTVKNIAGLSHPTVQKFTIVTVAIVGASRRFLSQITRHQNEVKFMSASLQYSNYSGLADFAIPYEILAAPNDIQVLYLESCQSNMNCYQHMCDMGINHDSAGYITPQGLRNILLIDCYFRATFLRNNDIFLRFLFNWI